MRQFVDNHLGPDGVFILRLIAQNYGDLVAGDTVGEIWMAYCQRQKGGTDNTTGPNAPEESNVHTDSYQRTPRSARRPGELESLASSRDGGPNSRFPYASGYTATLMATEMIHPSERYAVPLLTSTRKGSLSSRGSSRYSRDSRERDRIESPPPIPSRISEFGDSSISDHHPIEEQEELESEGQNIGAFTRDDTTDLTGHELFDEEKYSASTHNDDNIV